MKEMAEPNTPQEPDWLDEIFEKVAILQTRDGYLLQSTIVGAKEAISAKFAEQEIYNNKIVLNVRMTANANGPATWLDPVSGKKLYNEAKFAELFDEFEAIIGVWKLPKGADARCARLISEQQRRQLEQVRSRWL